MVYIQLKQNNYKRFVTQLVETAEQKPLDASFSFTMKINEAEYALKIQPDRHRKVYALQALEIGRMKNRIDHRLITDNRFLFALLNIMARQALE